MLLKVRLLLSAIAIMAVLLIVLGLTARSPDPGRALVAAPASPQDMLAKLTALSPATRAKLRERERHELERNPLDTGAIFNLAVLAELDGDTAARDKLIGEGAKRSRRDARVQLAALPLATGAGKFERAADILDGLLRSRPELDQQVMPQAAAVVADGQGLDAIARLVARDPPWRQRLLKHLVTTDPSGGQAYRYLAGLARRGVAPADRELAALIAPMVKSKAYAKAYFTWLDLLPVQELQKAGTIFDGAFELPPRSLYFDWTLRASKNASVDVKLRDGSASDRALVVSLLDNRQLFAGAGQYLRLGPGTYQLAAEALVKGARSSSGLVWRVRCLEQPALLGESSAFAADQPWSGFEFSFAVPDRSCETQLLQLESRSTTAPDLVMTGQLSFDNFRIAQRQ